MATLMEQTRWSNLQCFPNLTVPVVVGFSNHPTLADIAERDLEIAHLKAMDVGP